MKLNNQPYRTVALLLLVLLAAACTGEDDFATLPDEGTASAAPLTITVTDGAYAPAPEPDGGNTPDTRAVERGYGTEFTKGDKIGLYVVEDGVIVTSNLCLTLSDYGNWESSTAVYYTPNRTYYAYYPWQSDEYMASKIDVGNNDFFAPLVASWSPKTDQRYYTDYTASDLMTATGKCTTEANTGDYKLDFIMSHRMALAIVKINTVKKFTKATGDNKIKYHSKAGLPQLNAYYCKDGYRYLVNTETTKTPIAMSLRYVGEPNESNFSIPYENLKSGQYRNFNLQNVQNPDPEERKMKFGDYFMEDGTIVPKEASAIPEGCIGVVILIYNPTGNDNILKIDYPNCNHGVVLALKNAGISSWSDVNEKVNDWTNSDQPEDKLQYININNTSTGGYSKTMVLKAYNSAFADKKVQAVEVACSYDKVVPPPTNSSCWYCPSKLNLFYLDSSINGQLVKAGGESIEEFWTSTEYNASASWCSVSHSQYSIAKNQKYKVRPVLAF